MASELTVDNEFGKQKQGRTRTRKASPDASLPTAKRAGRSRRIAGRNLEIFGVVAVALTLLLFLCLVSYDRADVALSGAAAESGETANLIGPVGAHFADLLLTLLGMGAFLLSLTLGLTGLAMLFNRSLELGLRDVLGYLLFLPASSSLLQLCFTGQRFLDHLPGGLLGELLGEVARSLLGTVGASLLGWTLVLISLMVVTRLSLAALLRAIWLGVSRTLAWSSNRIWRGLGSMSSRLAARVARARHQKSVEASGSAPREHSPDPGAEGCDWCFGDEEPGHGIPEGDGGTWSFAEDGSDEGRGKQADTPGPPSSGAETGPAEASARPVGEPGGDAASGAGPEGASEGPASLEQGLGRPSTRSEGGARRSRGKDADAAKEGGPLIIQHQSGIRQLPFDDRPLRVAEEGGAVPRRSWVLPSLSLLDYVARPSAELDREGLKEMARDLKSKLADYGVNGEVREIHPGPVVTLFEFEPAPGVRISKIANLSDDLAMSLAALRVRIVAPIPGKKVVGIEVPSLHREIVYLKELIGDASFHRDKMLLPLCLGKDIIGHPVVRDLAKMPHLLVAGATGSGKSVLVNALVISLLYRFSPDEMRLIMVDPKQLEFAVYEGIPQLLLPVVTDPKKAAAALKWAVAEMERRYALMREAGVRQLRDYNVWVDTRQEDLQQLDSTRSRLVVTAQDEDPPPDLDGPEKLPYVVVIIDEFADLMMVASKDVEFSVQRLAQKARAAGIHLILATQRPSVDVMTGPIKANFPARVGLKVAQKEDSRTIVGRSGAENLLGDGDMLVMSPGMGDLTRMHGALVKDEEIRLVCAHWKEQGRPVYDMDILNQEEGEGGGGKSSRDEIKDDMYDEGVEIVSMAGFASASMLQRRLHIGYNRAARMIDIMEREGIVGPPDGARSREVLVSPPPDI